MKQRIIFIICLVGLSVLPLTGLFHAGLPLTHDGQDHVVRIANFYQDLSEGIIVPRWAANLNWGYGHPILMFLYPLPSYSAAFFHALGFSFVDSTKLVFGLAFIASGLTMFLWIAEEFGVWEGFLAAVLYLFAPYRFVELYVRGDIGEHVAFIFMPLILYFMRKTATQKKPYLFEIGGAISMALLVLSHNAITILFLPLSFFYAVYLFRQVKDKGRFCAASLFILIFGFCLSAFFVVPAFFEGKYTLRDIVTQHGEYAQSFSPFWRFFSTVWSYGGTGQLSVQVGIVQWFVVIVSVIMGLNLRKVKDQTRSFFYGSLLLLTGALFLMMKESRFIWQHVSLIQKFQFPWRFLAVVVIVTGAIGGWFSNHIPRSGKKISIIALSVCVIILTNPYWYIKGYLYKPESYFTHIYAGTTDTGESAPIWSVRFMERPAKAHLEVLTGQAVIHEETRLTNRHEYKVTTTPNTRVRENTIYFPGWHVLIDGTEVQIQYQDPANRGLMTFPVSAGTHKITVVFTETKLRLMADILSVVTLLCLCLYAILQKLRLWPRSL